ncbi:hypothetical protein Kpol_526p46 [Vanderwaltozyma polyspora DSM 70294]|uniref:Uncharacterized protein n=1 Tax=Vanderwaltozyma polyspora (strain ATCC 22028 / DSM 70294 / BCRC 21397 / CBS 2163 / NBRC 10782 / NRRL Y-8283 / UCD 57-17) TaxID=436907 RepID=A7TLV1_VANPO|nr:uncharacterized protein Kpol_526p46 [Vanderwaltozyma polyspora DSM 70294]EDO16793.1 hypothetical protein Kpol_526p46 [Vanderwaltozyma polyspora DSM 70294]
MSGMFQVPGQGAGAGMPRKPKSKFQEFRESPMYTVLVNGAFFVAGVAFIHSPLMEMLAPEL